MTIRQLTIKDLDTCFALRLESLANAPLAYMTTLTEEKERGYALFTTALTRTDNENIILGAFHQEKMIGMAGIRRGDRPKIRHKSMIWGVYVTPELRGSGYGAKLIDACISVAKDIHKTKIIILTLETANVAARKLYESRGFKLWGTEPEAMGEHGEYHDEDHMNLFL